MPSASKNGKAQQEYERHPFLLSVDQIVQYLGTNLETGLTGDAKIQELQQKYGPNRLSDEGGVKWYALLGKQVSNAMVLVSLFLFFLYCTDCFRILQSVYPATIY